MTKIVLKQLALQLRRVDQIAVVSQHNAKGGIHIERLRLRRARSRTCCRIPAMRDTHIAGQAAHIAGAEYVTHQAFVFVHMKRAAIGGDDSGCILPAMLQYRQAVIQQLIHRTFGDNANDAAHGKSFIGSSLFAPINFSSFCSRW